MVGAHTHNTLPCTPMHSPKHPPGTPGWGTTWEYFKVLSLTPTRSPSKIHCLKIDENLVQSDTYMQVFKIEGFLFMVCVQNLRSPNRVGVRLSTLKCPQVVPYPGVPAGCFGECLGTWD